MKRYCTLLFFLLFANFANARNEEGSKTSDKPACTKPVVLVSPKKQTLCYGTSTSFTYTASSSTPGLTYQWYGLLSDTTSNFSSSIIAGATSSQYEPAVPSIPGTYYLAVITKNQECADTSYVSLILEAQPERITNKTLCEGQFIKLSVTGSGAGTIYSWTPNSETDSTITVSVAGTYTCTTTDPIGCLEAFTWNINYNPNPVVNITGSSFICSGLATSLTANGGTIYEWTKEGSTGVLSSSAILPNIQTAGTYLVKVSDANNCSTIKSKNIQAVSSPKAGIDTLACSPNTTFQLASIVSGGTWSSASTNPVNVQIGATSGLISGLNADGRYYFVMTNTSTSCTDTVLVERRDCTKGRIGNYVWNDLNNNGIQDDGSVGVANVTLELYKGGVLQNTTISDASGFYSFENLESGDYQVKAASLPNNYILTAQHDAGSDDAIDSDFDPNTLMSQSITIDVNTTGVLKYNLTADLGVINSCVKPYAGKDTILCEGITSFDLKDASILEKWIVALGNSAQIDANTGNVTGLSASGDYSFVLYYTLGGLMCSDTVKITINSVPDVAAMGGNASCISPNVTLSSVVNPFGGSYQWTGPNSFSSGLKNPVVNAVGNYNLVYSINGCSSTSIASVSGDITVPFAGVDTSICSTATSINLKDAASNEAWYIVAGNPAAATIDASSGLVSGMNTVGFYQFILKNTTNFCVDTIKVEVKTCPINCTKPNAGADQVLACANAATNQLTTSTNLTGIPTGGTWAVASQPVGASAIVSNAGAVSGMILAGDYQFIYTVGECKDTIKIQVETCAACVKPNAGADVSICEPSTTAKLTAQSTGGTWTASNTNPATTLIDANGNISGITANGIYQYIYSVSSGGQVCSDTAIVTRNAKPNAGNDQVLACANAATNQLTTSTNLTGIPTGGTWVVVSQPLGASAIVSNAGVVSGMSLAGDYQFVYTVGGCSDTIKIQVETCAACVKPNAGADVSICEPSTTAKLTAQNTGGAWTASSSNPATSIIDASGNISGITANRVYQYIYSVSSGGQVCSDTAVVTRNAKPNAGIDQVLACANAATNQLTTSTSLTGIPTGGTWAVGIQPLGASAIVSNAGAVSGMSLAGDYQFVYSVGECHDTIKVQVETCAACVKPNAGADVSICEPATTAKLTAPSTGGIWTAVSSNPATTLVDVSGNISGITANGVYQYIYSVSSGGQVCSDTAIVTRNAKPNAGNDQVLACANAATNQLTTSTNLTGIPTGGTWVVVSQPLGASAIVSNAGVVSGMSLAGDYQFVYTVGGCSDTIKIQVETCAACVKPNAGADVSICEPSTTAKLTAQNTGGAWTASNTNPATTIIDASGNISGITANGTYQYIYSVSSGGQVCSDTAIVTRNAKPNAGADQVLACANAATNQLTTRTNLTGIPTGGTWSVASQPVGASAIVSNAGAVSGMSLAGDYHFIYSVGDCKDTIKVQVEACAACVKPNAGADVSICEPSTTAKLTAQSTGGAWTVSSSNPATTIIDANGNISGITANGVYQYIYSVSSGGQVCSDTAVVTKNAKPNAGNDQVLACANAATNQLTTSTNLTGIPTGGTWVVASQPLGASAIVSNAGAVSGMSLAGDYQFVYSVGDCKDTIKVQVETCVACVKPNAGADVSICEPATTAKLIALSTGGTWTVSSSNPATSIMDASGNISGITANGVYQYIYSVSSGGQVCSDTAVVTKNAKPNAGNDQVLACANAATNQLTTSTNLTGIPTGGTWAVGSQPLGASAIVSNAGAVSGMSLAGDYHFIYSVGDCKDTIKVQVETCAACVKPNAGADVSICGPATTVKLTAQSTGGVWTASNTNPATTIIDASGNISGITANGVYQYIYSVSSGGQVCSDTAIVTRNAKPNAGIDQVLACANAATNQLTTSTNLTGIPTGGTWAVASQPLGASAIVSNAGAVSGMSLAGDYQFIYTVGDCKDTIKVQVETCAGCVKPNAGADVSICEPATTAKLIAQSTGGAWTASNTNPSTSIIDADGNVSGITANGIYQYIYSVSSGGQVCSDTAIVIRRIKPTVSVVSKVCNTPGTLYTVSFVETQDAIILNNKGTFAGNSITNIPSGETVKITAELDGCTDSVLVTQNCQIPTGSISSIVWADLNDNGIQDEPSGSGVANVIIELYKFGSSTPLAIDTTDANGYYNFSNLESGEYQVKLVTTVLPGAYMLSYKKNVGPDDYINSDIDFLSGLSPVITIDVLGQGQIKNITSIGAALVRLCIVPIVMDAKSIPATCINGTITKNAGFRINAIGVDRFTYSMSKDSLAAYNKAILIDSTGITSTNTIPNPSNQQGQLYYVRMYSGGGDWYADTTITIPRVECSVTCTQPNAGTDQVLVCANAATNQLTTSTSLTGLPTGGIWSVGSQPSGAFAIVSNAGVVNGMSLAGNYQFIYSVGTCKDTVLVKVESCTGCTQPNAGADQLLACTNNQLTPSTSLTGLPTGGIWSVGSQPSGAFAIVSNAGVVNGMSLAGNYQFVYSVGTCKDTVLVKVESCKSCIKPNAGADINICSSTNTYNLADAKVNEEWYSLDLNPINVAIDAKTGLISGMNDNGVYGFILKDTTFGNTCSDTMFIFRGVSHRLTYRTCDTLTISSYPNVVWTPLISNPAIASIDAQGHVLGMTAVGIYKFSGTNGACTEIISIEKQDCATTSVDISLSQFQNSGSCEHKIGDIIDFTVVVRRNDSNSITAMGISIKDSVSAGFSLMSSLVTKGSYNSNTGIWSGLSLAKGDSAILTLSLKITGTIKNGVLCNTAWLQTMDNIDIDSQAGDKNTAEDDYAAACISIPYKICPDRGESIVLTAPVGSTYQWQLNGKNIQGANAATYKATATGNYTVLVDNVSGCGAGFCCPFIVQEFCPCASPAAICVPMTVKRTR